MVGAPSKPGSWRKKSRSQSAAETCAGDSDRDESDTWALEKDTSETGPALECDIWQEFQVPNVLHGCQESQESLTGELQRGMSPLTKQSLALGQSCPCCISVFLSQSTPSHLCCWHFCPRRTVCIH